MLEIRDYFRSVAFRTWNQCVQGNEEHLILIKRQIDLLNSLIARRSHRRCKKLLLKVLQNSKENARARASF